MTVLFSLPSLPDSAKSIRYFPELDFIVFVSNLLEGWLRFLLWQSGCITAGVILSPYERKVLHDGGALIKMLNVSIR